MREDSDALAPGTLVGGYRIEHRLGSGGMGTVYAAEEPTIKKRVAIKVLRRGLDPSVAARFEREARAANDVRHPAIVDVFAFGRLEDDRPYLVMSLLEGVSLGDELQRRGRIPLREAWAWAREVADALAAAHERGIVHRDLKPENVFLERFGDRPARPRLLDLGIAKLLARPDEDEPIDKLTQTGAPLGTPAYMAPEQWWGTDVDARADQYALGVTLFEMLVGRRPFRATQMIELGQQHLHATPPTLASEGVEAPEEVEALIARALAKSPDDRFPTMRALVEAGDRALGVASIDPLAGTVAARSEASPVERVRPEPPVDAARASSSNARFLALLGALVVLGPAALVAVGYEGEERRDVRWWLRDAGPLLPAVLGLFVLGAIALARAARSRARSSIAPWALAIGVAATGLMGTFIGFRKSLAGVDKLDAPVRFEILHEGIFEIQISRFTSFYLASLLFVAIAAFAGVPRDATRAREPSDTRNTIAGAAALTSFAILSAVLGVPSAALVAFVAALVVALDALLPVADARASIERAAASFVALALALAVALARVEGRQAVLWGAQPTRAARAAEIIAAGGELRATLALGVASIVLVAALVALRFRRSEKLAGALRPSVAALALGVAMGGVAVVDVWLHGAFASARDRLHDELKSQFALFARLDPPSSGDLDPASREPVRAPALQIARNAIAVNADWKAPLAAALEEDGLSNLRRDLAQAMAKRAAAAGDVQVDLAVSIDREVAWRSARATLAAARRAGARRIEILLTHGPPLRLADDAPDEASWVLARDFVAVRAELGDEGVRASDDDRFDVVAKEIVRRARAGEPIVLAVR